MSETTLFEDKAEKISDKQVVEKDHGQGPPPIFKEPTLGSGGNGSNGDDSRPFGNSLIAMLLFIGADIMLFAGLIGAFMVFRFGAEGWPPAGQPLLPIGVTGVNTAILLLSGLTMIKTWRLLSNWNRQTVLKWLTITVIFGTLFLVVQGFEWLRLIGFGLTLNSGVYGATFYTIIGCHALHVVGAVVWLSVVTFKLKLKPNSYNASHHTGIKLIGMYWLLVVALWPVLYGLVYLG